MCEVFINGNLTSVERGREFSVHQAIMSGMEPHEALELYNRGLRDSIDGEIAREILLEYSVEIVMSS